jgi:hypothetical protein
VLALSRALPSSGLAALLAPHVLGRAEAELSGLVMTLLNVPEVGDLLRQDAQAAGQDLLGRLRAVEAQPEADKAAAMARVLRLDLAPADVIVAFVLEKTGGAKALVRQAKVRCCLRGG